VKAWHILKAKFRRKGKIRKSNWR